ncbi:hypothetical protein B0H14DRAFT_2646484 [Mycena olivaceomarginata]|nr:hypothetical protein B0H14DRAFT_2646484 [Mycena olivaceomarginata]
MHRPQHDYALGSDDSIVEIERPYEFIRSARAPPYLPPPNLIYGRTIKEESPLPRIKLKLSPLQPLRSSSRMVRDMLTPDNTNYYFDSDSPDVSLVSGVHVPTHTESSAPRSAQSSQPASITVEEKQKALERLSGLRSKSSKTAAPVQSKRKSSRDDDEEVDKPPRKRQKKSEEGSGKQKRSDEVGKDDGKALKRLKKRIEKGAQPAQPADRSPTPPPRPKPRPIFKGRKGCPPGVRAPVS